MASSSALWLNGIQSYTTWKRSFMASSWSLEHWTGIGCLMSLALFFCAQVDACTWQRKSLSNVKSWNPTVQDKSIAVICQSNDKSRQWHKCCFQYHQWARHSGTSKPLLFFPSATRSSGKWKFSKRKHQVLTRPQSLNRDGQYSELLLAFDLTSWRSTYFPKHSDQTTSFFQALDDPWTRPPTSAICTLAKFDSQTLDFLTRHFSYSGSRSTETLQHSSALEQLETTHSG